MTTALATIDTNNFLALSGDAAEMREAMAANLGENAALRESDLTRILIPSGGSTTKWTIPSLAGDETVDAIEGVLAYQCVRGLIWPSEEPEEGTLPAMVTHDLKTGKLVADADKIPEGLLNSFNKHPAADAAMMTSPEGREYYDAYDWPNLAQCQWGTGKGGNGKYAKEQRVLYILRESDPLPVIVCVQPGSLGDWQKFVLEMTKAGIPFWRAVISLSLAKDKSSGGQPYCRIVPKLIGTLSREQGAAVREQFTTLCESVAKTSFAG